MPKNYNNSPRSLAPRWGRVVPLSRRGTKWEAPAACCCASLPQPQPGPGSFFGGGAPLPQPGPFPPKEGRTSSSTGPKAPGLPLLRRGSSPEPIFYPVEIEQISDHMKKHEKPLGEAEFGYYLAGLIEGSGYFGDQ